MSLIPGLELKYGRFAIPGLVQIIAVLQVLVVILVTFMAPESRIHYLLLLELEPDKVMQGEVWRLFSHVLIPWRFSLIWVLLGAWLMTMIGRTLDHAWGAFRVNLYVFGWLLIVDVGALVFGWPTSSLYLYQTLFFAFAALLPDFEISLYFVLPVKIKWVAFLLAGMTAFSIVREPALVLPVIVGHLNFLVFFGPGFLSESARMARITARRGRFEAAKLPDGTFFHQCSVCKKTELDDAKLDFRVLDSGDEICNVCKDKRG
jgi:hypothetical protein